MRFSRFFLHKITSHKGGIDARMHAGVCINKSVQHKHKHSAARGNELFMSSHPASFSLFLQQVETGF